MSQLSFDLKPGLFPTALFIFPHIYIQFALAYWQQILLLKPFSPAEGVCLLWHIIKHSEMPVGLRGREVDNGTLDVLISNNGLFRQLCALIFPDWPLAWISLIPHHSRQGCAEGPSDSHALLPSVEMSNLVDIMTPCIHINESLKAVNYLVWHQCVNKYGSCKILPIIN